MINKKLIARLCLLGSLWLCPMAAFAKLNVVSAENVYGELAQQLGGDYVQVTSILSNPAQDPHLFNAAPSVAKAIADADIIVYNGMSYDAWMQKLLTVKGSKVQQTIVVADLLGAKAGMNPHLWYDPATMPLLAQALTNLYAAADKPHAAFYQQRLAQFLQEYQALQADIYRLKLKFQGTPVIATEPVFGYLAQALGLQMHGEALQWSIMNETSPSPAELKVFEDEIRQRQVRLVIYNQQVSQPLVQRLLEIAKAANVPTLGVTETQPANTSYIQWMQTQLTELEKALINDKP